MAASHHTHDADEHLTDLTDHLVGIIDDPARADAAVRALVEAGVAERDVMLLAGPDDADDVVDPEGAHGGYVRRLLRALQWANRIEGERLQEYEEALEAGSRVVTVRMHGAPGHEPMLGILTAHGARTIHAYNALTVEDIKEADD